MEARIFVTEGRSCLKLVKTLRRLLTLVTYNGYGLDQWKNVLYESRKNIARENGKNGGCQRWNSTDDFANVCEKIRGQDVRHVCDQCGDKVPIENRNHAFENCRDGI